MNTIGDRIKSRRLELNMSVDDLAAKLGKNRATVYRYESYGIVKLPITVLAPLAKALETTPAYLMGWEDKKEVEATANTGNHFDFNQLTDEQLNVLQLLEPLTEDQQRLIVATVRAIAEEIISGRDKK